ncbi:MAG: antitoxin family protein [Desulfurococcales archaeon]|nr:antitoxin family protein [Desulfurococcales archaeon]
MKRSVRERLIALITIDIIVGLEMSRVIKVVYEKGVLKPLDHVDLKEGKEYRIIVEEDIDELIKKYRGVLGKSSIEEFRELEEEAQTQ